ncbi:MAG: tRNA (adenosine(37)-N6)-threonylcarbamoyltransferase complex transferase subunit TsaD [bacterium]|nr:tRNA (adenosine(37)-N6)-threonylcarbamoyltransferase complex transferase subunit TsaD [bacterium]
MARILGIETSCDETAAAIVDDRTEVLSSVIASQIEVHRAYGGVVPEIAARHHVEAISPVVRRALDDAGCTFDSIDAVAVTSGPGLIGCLLVGISAAKAIAWSRRLPLLAVNHLEGHVRSAFIEQPQIEYPALALVVSGGHTALYLCPEEGVYRTLAKTRDDAAGEAFDKVAKLLGLGYPGGPVIERISRGADANAFELPQAQMKDGSLDFSFSGLKSAVRRLVQDEGLVDAGADGEVPQRARDLAASFQKSVIRVLVKRTLRISRRESVRSVLVTGGVACNGALRAAFEEAVSREDLSLYIPAPRYTTDNAAMIAAAGFLHLDRGAHAGLDLNADAAMKL